MMRLKSQFLRRLSVLLLLTTVLFVWKPAIYSKAHPQQFTAPTQITIEMHALNDDGSLNTQLPGGSKCYSVSANHTKYGCTYYDGNIGLPFDPAKDYPFTSDTITINIESDTTAATDGTQQGYLHNIVSQEMAAGAPLSSYTAQAIAARTYTYHFHNTITNNSASFHVYIAYRYEGVAEEGTPPGHRQQKVNYAVTQSSGIYMSSPGSDTPIFAAYGQDNCVYTKDKTSASPHLKSVYDPISEQENQPTPPQTCSNDDTGRRTVDGGMGSNGAARWGRGNTNPYGNGDTWSVQWGEPADIVSGESWKEAYRILTHYYSDIEIRNQYDQILTPAYRWNPLILDWGGGVKTPPPMWYGGDGTYNVTVTLQNTGHYPWTHSNQGGSAKWYLSYRWRKGNTVQDGSHRVEITQSGQPSTVSEGQHRIVTLTVSAPPDWGAGDYILQLDMLYEATSTGNITWFNDEQSREWFTYDIEISATICIQSNCSGGGANKVYLPIIYKGAEAPPPTNCTWEGNKLSNSHFGANLLNWTVWIDQGIYGGFTNINLYEGSNYYSPDSGTAGAFLGGENDAHQPTGGDNNDQYITQSVIVEDTQEVEALRVGFSYCLVTYEQTSLVKDKFMADLQAGTLGTGSAFPDILTYTNLDAYSAADANNCKHDSGQWVRRERYVHDISQNFSGDRMFTLVFYSDVNDSQISRFYFDTAEVDVCRR